MTPEDFKEAREFESCQEYDFCRAEAIIEMLLEHIDSQADEIKRLEDALVEERKGLECAGCGKRYEDVRGKSGKDGDLLLGEIRLDPGSPANHVEPEISYEIYFWCVECGRMHDR